MRVLARMILIGTIVCLAATASLADLAPFSQDFETLTPAPQELPATSLGDDGWLFYGNVFGLNWDWWGGYGPFVAPNHGGTISAVVSEQGGPDQGFQQLSVFSDYGNGNHPWAWIETNVFKEQAIGAADVGNTWRFEFDAKRGNIEGNTMANGFIKTLDPAANYAMTNFITADMTYIPDAWGSYQIDIYIDPSLVGQILQVGFVNWTTNWQGSGIYYDNANFDLAPLGVNLDLKPGGCPNPITSAAKGVFPAAIVGTYDFDVSNIDAGSLLLQGVAPVSSGYEDVATPFGGGTCGCTNAGPDGLTDLTMKFRAQDIFAAIGSSARGTYVLTLTGMLLDGREIEGQDCIIIVGGGGGSPTALQGEVSDGNVFGGGNRFDSRSGSTVDTDNEEPFSLSKDSVGKSRKLRLKTRAQ